MSFLDTLLGRNKRNDNDWIQPELRAWNHIGREEGLEYYVDWLSCYKGGKFYWWILKIQSPGEYQDFLICLGSPERPSILVPVKQMMSDPGLKPIGNQNYKIQLSFEENPVLLECLEWVVSKTTLPGFVSEPPYVTYANLLMSKW